MKEMFKNYKLIMYSIIVLFLILSPVIWYTLPYECRGEDYRLRYGEEFYTPLLEVDNFDISREGFSETYELQNHYVMPIAVEFLYNKLPPVLPRLSKENRGKIVTLNTTISIDIIVDGISLVETEFSKDIKVSYSWVGNNAAIYIGKIDYPLRARFSNDVNVKIKIIEADKKLVDGKGHLIFRPFPYR
jgi:hypothetical protein